VPQVGLVIDVIDGGCDIKIHFGCL
jgi:hypothetical protein